MFKILILDLLFFNIIVFNYFCLQPSEVGAGIA
jgi:hypothetical protein